MMLIDTHCHIYSQDFGDETGPMIDRALAADVKKMLMPAVDSESHDRMISLEKYPGVYSMMGLHPCSVKEDWQREMEIVTDWFDKRKFIAVGETGLDFYWDKTFVKEQYAAFEQQINLAKQFDIPVVIHSRNATDECIDVIRKHQDGKLKGVFHCYSGTTEQAKTIIGLDFYLGIGGVLTFKNGGLDKVLNEIGLEKIVLETDAPYLAPVPYRGKRNEPAYIKLVAEKLAALKEISTEEIAAITTANAKKLFSIE